MGHASKRVLSAVLLGLIAGLSARASASALQPQEPENQQRHRVEHDMRADGEAASSGEPAKVLVPPKGMSWMILALIVPVAGVAIYFITRPRRKLAPARAGARR